MTPIADQESAAEIEGDLAQPLEDGQLVAQLQAGNLEALGGLYERHKLRVYRTALAITHDPSAAEDILQSLARGLAPPSRKLSLNVLQRASTGPAPAEF